jgi:exodeoxyribonuclease V beta subunit
MSVRISKPALLEHLSATHEVIEASAGTGKTYTLQRLVADLIIQGTSTIDRILVVTFTEKATQELRTRIRSYLQEVHDQIEDDDSATFWEVDAEARARVAAALRGFERASISTIHGFCRQVLQEAALEGRTLFDRELADERALFGRAFRDALNRVFTQNLEQKAMLEAALAAGSTVEALEDDLWSVHADGGELLPRLDTWREWIGALDPTWFTQADALALDWKAAKVHHSTTASAAKALAARATALPAAHSDYQRAQVFDGLNLGSLWKATSALTGDHGPLHAWLARGEASLLSPEALQAHHFLGEVRDTQRRLEQAEGLFTFQGMIHGVVDALDGADGETLAQRLRQRYDIALVDEFQDTDPLQWKVFRRIFLQEERRLVIIGDPKQAIYGFRGGDLPTYQEACRELLGSAAPKRLEQNFRSTAPVIEAYNHILSGNGPDSFFGDPTLYPSPVRCGRPDLSAKVAGAPIKPVDILVLDAMEGGQRLWKRLARQLALRMRDLVAGCITFGEPGQERILGFGDVQILVGKSSEGELMAKALRAEGIPCAFYKQKGLFQTREAEEWLDALRAVADPRNRSLQLRTFLSAFFGYDLEELRALPTMSEEHPALQRLLAWGSLAQQHRFAELLDAMQEESGLTRRLLLAEAGYRSLVNVRHIAESLMNITTQRRVTLADLIRQLERWRSGVEKPSAEEADLQRLEGDKNAVQILTLHAAKGLEAPIVALFAFGKGRSSSLLRFHRDGARCLSLGSTATAIKAQAELEAREEHERLLYVGMTRAQAKLILCAFDQRTSKGELKKLNSAYDTLNQRLVGMVGERPDLFTWESVVALGSTSLAECTPILPEHVTLPPLPTIPPFDYAARAKAARPFATTSFTALQGRLEAMEPVLSGDRDQIGVRPSAGDLPAGTHTGQALHELLEWVDLSTLEAFEPWSKRLEVQAKIRETLDLHGLPRSCAAKVAEVVHAGLCAELPLAWGGSVRVNQAERLLREVDFFSRFLDADRFPDEKDLLKGSIDVLCESGGRIYVLDWKSNLLADYEPVTLHRAVMEHYLLQAQVYLLACLGFLDIRDEAQYEARFGGILYVFLRGLPHQGTWSMRPTWGEVQAWKRDLERVHREVILA